MNEPSRRLTRPTRRTAVAGFAAAVLLLGVGTGARALLSGEPSDSTTSTETTGESGMGAGDDNVAVGSNTRDGSEVYSVRLKIVQTTADVVDSGNAAVAAASCEDCTTVAIAIEGVLVAGDDVDEVTPVNLAIAVNSECTGCETLAAAYQYVTQNDTRVLITPEGRQTVASLRQQLNTLRLRDLSLEEVAAEADRIAMEFYDVLVNEVVPIGKLHGESPTPDAEATDDTTPTSEPTTSEESPSDDGGTTSPGEPASSTTAPESTPSESPTETSTETATATPSE